MNINQHLNLNLRPGIVTYFTVSGHGADVAEQRYITQLQQRSMRHGLEAEVAKAPVKELEGFTVARLFNVGNLANDAYVYIDPGLGYEVQTASLENLFDRLVDFTDWHRGSVDVTERSAFADFSPCARSIAAPPLQSKPKPKRRWSIFRKREEEDAELCTQICADEEPANSCCFSPAPISPAPSAADLEPELDLLELEEERRECLRRIGMIVMDYVQRYHEMPPVEKLLSGIQGKYILESDAKSPVVINGDMEIVLPNYDEMTLKLTPLCRAIYILFLLHPEGIVLKEISDYRSELSDIYYLVKPGANPELARASVDDLCSPGSESLQQKISKIRRAVRSQLLNPTLTDFYSISGERGRSYSLPAAASLVRIPKALCRE